jgi:biopolymer transport protein ExbD
MPIHAAGPRLGSSIPFAHLGNKGGGGRRNVNAYLNLTAMVDMMTMLVVFLLSTFSATGELLMSQKGIELPTALNDKELSRAPIISITRDAIAFKGEAVGDPKAIVEDESPEWKIVELYDRLQLEKFNFEKQDIDEEKKKLLRGLVILQADRNVDAKVLNRVMKTAYAADYTEVMFATTRKPQAKR